MCKEKCAHCGTEIDVVVEAFTVCSKCKNLIGDGRYDQWCEENPRGRRKDDNIPNSCILNGYNG